MSSHRPGTGSFFGPILGREICLSPSAALPDSSRHWPHMISLAGTRSHPARQTKNSARLSLGKRILDVRRVDTDTRTCIPFAFCIASQVGWVGTRTDCGCSSSLVVSMGNRGLLDGGANGEKTRRQSRLYFGVMDSGREGIKRSRVFALTDRSPTTESFASDPSTPPRSSRRGQ